MRSILPASILAAVLATGCAATVASRPGYGPDLVTVSPGVQVIADYNEPIFYSDGFYWRYYGGVWYRSSYYTGGWVYARPPVAVLRIDRPHSYVHYRPHGWRGQPRTVAPAYGGGWRSPPPAAARRPPAYAAPRPAAPPPPARVAPAQGGGWRGPPPAHGGPPRQHGGGWRGQ